MRALGCLLFLFVVLNTNAQNVIAEKAACKNVVTGFLKWYQKNSEKLGGLSPLKTLKPVNENNQHFTIDWKKAEKYFSYIRSNVTWLGDGFIKNEIAFFKTSEKLFVENPADEMPIGFDYDRFIDGQEDASFIVPELIKHLALWKVVINRQTAKVYDEHMDTDREGKAIVVKDQFELVKEKGRWKISKCLGWHDYTKDLGGAILTISTKP